MKEFYNHLQKENITPDTHLILYNLSKSPQLSISTPIFIELVQLGLIRSADKGSELTDKGRALLIKSETFFRKQKKVAPGEVLGENYLEQIKIYRSKFPSGKKSTEPEVIDKCIQFFNKFTGQTWEKLLKATDLYIQEADLQYHYKAGNFLKVTRNGVDTYPAKEWIEKLEENPETNYFINAS